MSNPNTRGWILWPVVAALAVGVAVVGVKVVGGGEAPEGGGPQAAGGVPQVSFERWDGSQGALADYRGRPLVLNFWASWCPPCVAEMPGFEQIHQQMKGEVAFLGIDLQDDRAAAQALVEQTGVTYDLGVDPTGEVFRAFEGIGMPTTVFISSDGQILDKHTGLMTPGQLQARIQELFLR